MRSYEYCPGDLRNIPDFACGRNACVHPYASYEFAGDFRKNGFICRVDAGIDPSNGAPDFVLNIRPGG